MFQNFVKSSISSQISPTSTANSAGKVEMIDDALSSYTEEYSVTDMIPMMPLPKNSEDEIIFVLPKDDEDNIQEDIMVNAQTAMGSFINANPANFVFLTLGSSFYLW